MTEYSALWKGEVEIGAWEIASGCGNSWIAWFLNFGSFGVGLFLYPRAMYKAFMKGRQVTQNLYVGYEYDESLLNRSVGELRKEFGMEKEKPTTFFDTVLFYFCGLLVLLEITLFIALFCVMLGV